MTTTKDLPETFTEVLVACITAAGGSGIVGPKLWPEKEEKAAQRLLLACMKEDRAERLTPDQVLFIFKMARAKGFHLGMAFLCHQLCYAPPVPVEPRDEMADLQREYMATVERQAGIAARMEAAAARLAQFQPLRAAA